MSDEPTPQPTSSVSTCCAPSQQATCCEPGDKAACCGEEVTADGSCGCR